MSTRLTMLLVLLFTLRAGSGMGEGQSEPAPTPVWKSAAPLVIDGVLDEPAWDRATRVRADFVMGKTGQRSEDRHMEVRYTWDDDYFYIGYETFDRNLVALGTGKKKGPAGNQREGCEISHATEPVDVVEFFISFGDLRFFWEIHHNAANQFNDIWCNVYDDSWPISKSSIDRYGIHFGTSEFIRDDEESGRTLVSAVKLKPAGDGRSSTLNDPRDVDTGYVGEIRIPWAGLGAPRDRETVDAKRRRGPWKMEGQQMLVLAVVQDGDLKDRYHHSSPTFPGGWFHKGATHYPRLDLAVPTK
jgi:hypothetical protein